MVPKLDTRVWREEFDEEDSVIQMDDALLDNLEDALCIQFETG